VKAIVIFPILFLSQYLFAQNPVTNLHYKYTENLFNKKNERIGQMFDYNFNTDSNILVMDRIIPNRLYLRQIVDIDKGLMVAIKNIEKDYVIETLDSIYYHSKVRLKPTNESKQINGYNCSEYKLKLSNFRAEYNYSVWTTTELKMNDSLKQYIWATFTETKKLYPFEGVIMKVDIKITQTLQGHREWNTEIVLDTSQLYVKPQKLVWPWNETRPGAALVQITNAHYVVLRAGDKTSGQQNDRMKELAKETTGQEKPRFKYDNVSEIFW
jgi:hypothetical protein